MIGQRLTSILLAICILFSTVPSNMMAEENPPVDTGDDIWENSGDWLIEEGDTLQHTGRTIIINGNLTINGTLTLENCDLVMNRTDCGLYVNGEFVIRNSTITGKDTFYDLIVHGTLEAVGTDMSWIGGATSEPYIGGLQAYSDNIILTDCSISFSEFTGLYVGSNITVRNSSIENNIINVIVNDSSPLFIASAIRSPMSINLLLTHSASPSFINCVQQGELRYEDDTSSMQVGHQLDIHVVRENGSSFPWVDLMITSNQGDSRLLQTDGNGWIRELDLAEFTVYRSSADKVYTPYTMVAERDGVRVTREIAVHSSKTVEIVLTGSHFGASIARGDFNGDDVLDLAVGAPAYVDGSTSQGAVHIFLNDGSLELSSPGPGQSDITLTGAGLGGFGSSLEAGDINGDGFDDLLVGASETPIGIDRTGQVLFYFGSEEPQWDDRDPSMILDSIRGTGFGRIISILDLDGDRFHEFIIGDDENSYVYRGCSEPVLNYSGSGSQRCFATTRGTQDTTSGSLNRLATDDNKRYSVLPPDSGKDVLHLTNFTAPTTSSELLSVTLSIQYTTDQAFGFYMQERGSLNYRIGPDGSWNEAFKPIADAQHWTVDKDEAFGLKVRGVDTIQEIGDLEILYENLDGMEYGGVENSIHFDFITVDVTYEPQGPLYILEPGIPSIGDPNGDGYPDLILSSPGEHIIHFGRTEGISPPVTKIPDLTSGTFDQVRSQEGRITLGKIGGPINGDFDEGWENWTLTNNARNVNSGGWQLTKSAHGDWLVFDGATASLGPKSHDFVATEGAEAGYCDGMLVSDPFSVPDGYTHLDLWYHAKWWSFEDANGGEYQDGMEDAIIFRIVNDTDDSMISRIQFPEEKSEVTGEGEGRLRFNVSNCTGHMIRLEVELITNHWYYDDGLFQIDDVHLSPFVYGNEGSFLSDWITADEQVAYVTPSWETELNGGSVSVKFRYHADDEWSNITSSKSGENIHLPTPSDQIQYRVDINGNGVTTPEFWNLSLDYLFVDQISPLKIQTDHRRILTANLNTDTFDDLILFSDSGLEIHPGSANLSTDFSVNAISSFFSGDINDVSVLDLDRDGISEIVISGPTIKIIDNGSDMVWEAAAFGSVAHLDVISDPTYNHNSGRVMFVPASDREVRLVDIEVPEYVDPAEMQNITVTVGNPGRTALENFSVLLNITNGGYSETFELLTTVPSMSIGMVTFNWSVPGGEGKFYHIQAHVALASDPEPADNVRSVSVRSRQHSIDLTAISDFGAAHGGEKILYDIALSNTGTYSHESVSLSSVLPPGWSGTFLLDGDPVTTIMVEDEVGLRFEVISPHDEMSDTFTITLQGTAMTSTSNSSILAQVLRPDLIVDEIVLLRGDDVEVNDTINGVEGDLEEIRIRIVNIGPTYATAGNLSISINDIPTWILPHGRMEPGEERWVSHTIIPTAGTLNVSAMVDAQDSVPEVNESNNLLERGFIIKDDVPLGSYLLTGIIMDLDGSGVGGANVTIAGQDIFNVTITDQHGRFAIFISVDDYVDGLRCDVRATDGGNHTNATIILYSQDQSIDLALTLDQYIVTISAPSLPTSIGIGETSSFNLTVTNDGNTNSTFLLTESGVPAGWSVWFPDHPGGTVYLQASGTKEIPVMISASPLPDLSQGHTSHSVTFTVQAVVFAQANDRVEHEITVEPYRFHDLSVIGETMIEGAPGNEVVFSMTVRNDGNLIDTFIPGIEGLEGLEYEFSITHVMLDIGEEFGFTLTITTPWLPTGQSVPITVHSTDRACTDAQVVINVTTIRNVECILPEDISANSGESLRIPMNLVNRGNQYENFTVDLSSPLSGINLTGGSASIDVGEETKVFLEIDLPDGIPGNDTVSINVTLSTNVGICTESSFTIKIQESPDLSMEIFETMAIPGIHETTYRYTVLVTNTGNVPVPCSFRAEGSHSELVSIPEPIELGVGDSTRVTADIHVPLEINNHFDTYLIPFDDQYQYDEILLRIASYSPVLNHSVEPEAGDGFYSYSIEISNEGTRTERLSLELDLPVVDEYLPGHSHWGGAISSDHIALMPGEQGEFTVRVTTPDFREYWGTGLSVGMRSASGPTIDIDLQKPPIPILLPTLPDFITIEDELEFTGSQSVWNIIAYHWDFGDGTVATGSTVFHSYSRAGVHVVTLTVLDDENLSASTSVQITVENIKPEPIIITDPINGTVWTGEPITLDGRYSVDRDGSIVEYLWMSEGKSDIEWPTIQLTYTKAGEYLVTLMVTDIMGEVNEISRTIHVVERPVDQKDDASSTPEEWSDNEVVTSLPLIAIILVLTIGTVVLMKKRQFLDHLEDRARERERDRS